MHDPLLSLSDWFYMPKIKRAKINRSYIMHGFMLALLTSATIPVHPWLQLFEYEKNRGIGALQVNVSGKI